MNGGSYSHTSDFYEIASDKPENVRGAGNR